MELTLFKDIGVGTSNVYSSSDNDAKYGTPEVNCHMTLEQRETFQDIRIADIALFSTVLALWCANILTMSFKRRLNNKMVISVLYSIIGLIIITRLVEVI